MKKVLKVIITIIILGSVSLAFISNNKTSAQQKDIAKKLIRFHVIANSDFDNDQKLKLQVKDKVLEYIQPKLKDCQDINESRKLLKENDTYIKHIAEKVIKDKGYNYRVSTELSFENFPVKTYGNITLPQGRYEAYRIIIGKGEGRNWWCVMFPPLCFVDVTKGETSYKKTEKQMKNVLNEEEYKSIDNRKIHDKNKKVNLKFKIVDMVKDILN